jgi:MATE family multidrug resistance protein
MKPKHVPTERTGLLQVPDSTPPQRPLRLQKLEKHFAASGMSLDMAYYARSDDDSDNDSDCNGDDIDHSNDGAVKTWLRSVLGMPDDVAVGYMLTELARNFIPAAGTTLLLIANQTITMMFVGQELGVDVLSHYTVGQSLFNIVGISLAQGMATALDTLCSQSYGRHATGPQLGEILQRGIFVCMLVCLPIICFFLTCDPLLVWLFGEEDGLGVAQFLHWAPLYLVFMTLYTCLQKALQAQNLPEIPLIAAFVSVCVCPIFNSYLTYQGLHGAVICMTLCCAVVFLVMLFISLIHPRVIIFQATWPSRHILDRDGLRRFWYVGVASLFSVCSEWWAFEVVVALATRLGTTEVGAYNVAFNICMIFFAMSNGMSIALGVLTGNCLGNKKPARAKAYVRMGFTLVLILMAVNLVIMQQFSLHFFKFYTHEAKVLQVLENTVPAMLLFYAGDTIQTCFQGAFRGVGRQNQSARVVLFSLWMVGVPCSYIFSNHLNWRVPGIFLGIVAGFLLEIPLLAYDMWFDWDWGKLAKLAAHEEMPTSPVTPAMEQAQFPSRRSSTGNFKSYGSLAELKL